MKIGLCSIQRDRGRWLSEWVAFHYAVGFRVFYIFLHRCQDDSAQIIQKLQKRFDIKCFILSEDVQRPQLVAWQFAYQNFHHELDWMGFIDGDEFLFPSIGDDIRTSLRKFQYEKISALGVWWICFGSNHHITEPTGYVIENYLRRPDLSHKKNRHFKSLVRGHQASLVSVGQNSHFFNTVHGTFDENLRPLEHGYLPNIEPTYDFLRINHYICQSYQFFKEFKQSSGAADAGSQVVRTEESWREDDINDVYDDAALRFLPEVKSLLTGL